MTFLPLAKRIGLLSMEDVKVFRGVSHSHSPTLPPLSPFTVFLFSVEKKKKEKVKAKVGSALVQFVRRSRASLEFTLGNTDRVVS